MIVIKIGGSLYSSPLLKRWLKALPGLQGKPVVIIAGGGPFADQVRRAHRDHSITQEACHEMAVLAMQQYAILLADQHECFQMVPDSARFNSVVDNQKIPVWAPYKQVMDECELAKDWNTTSDSLALWLAIRMNAQAIYLVKSAHVAVGDRTGIDGWSQRNIVDAAFAPLAQKYQGDIQLVHASQSDDFIHKLSF